MALSPTSPIVFIQKLIKITFSPGDRNERQKLSLKVRYLSSDFDSCVFETLFHCCS